MPRTKIFSVAFLLFFALFLFSNAVIAKDTWTRVASKNFNLIGNAGEREIRKVATKLEQFRETFRILFKTANFDAAIPTNVIVFKSASSYKPFKPKRADGKIDEFVAGYFMPGKDVNYITLSTEGEDSETFGTIFHEYVHFMVNMNFGKSDIPAWFNEGLAEYYQTFSIEKDQEVKLGMFQQGHIDLLSQSKLMPLDTLFRISNFQLHQQGNHSRSIFYAQSWALIHYLFQNQNTARGDGLGKFIDGLIKNVPPERAFQEAFQMTYGEMEKELKKYVNQHSYNYQILTLKQKLVFDAEMKVSVMAEAESNAYLGDLLAHTRRPEDAEPYLQKALELDPNSSLANTSMGTVKLRQRKFDEAKAYLEKAIAGDAQNHLAFYNYAFVLSREGRDDFGYVSSFAGDKAEKMRLALKKSIALNPAYTESYELMAFVNLVNNERLDESIVLLKQALKYQPGDQEIILRIAEILSRQEKFDDAKMLAEKISNSTTEPEIKARADNLAGNIETMQNVKARNEQMRKEYEAQRKQFEEQANQARTSGNRPSLTRRTAEKEKTPEEVARLNEEAQIFAVNQAIRKPTPDEKQLIGRITKIACVPKMIVFTVKSESGTVTLFSKDFQNLTLVAFGTGAESAQVGCNANLSAFNAVLTFNIRSAKTPQSGELVAIDFVPDNFRFMDGKPDDVISESNQLATTVGNAPGPTTDLTAAKDEAVMATQGVNTQSSTAKDFETRRRAMMIESLKRALRAVEAGETRVVGTIEKIECDNKGMYFVFKTENQSIKLKAPPNLQIRAFVPDAGGVAFECGMKQFNVNAVITYKPSGDKKAKVSGDLVALEFVPDSFKLD
jgi:tetratricopeptide (TPR) repeat protein